MMNSTITATATRCDGWWAVEFATPKGVYNTQAKRLDQVPALVCDVLALVGVEGDYAVEVIPDLPADLVAAIDEAKTSTATAEQATRDAAQLSRATVMKLRNEGLTVRDVGRLLGVTPQRVSQLAKP